MVMISRSQTVFPILREGSEFDPQCDYSNFVVFCYVLVKFGDI